LANDNLPVLPDGKPSLTAVLPAVEMEAVHSPQILTGAQIRMDATNPRNPDLEADSAKRTPESFLESSSARTRRPLSLEKVQRLHFIGIGGVGMSGIAQLCLSRGFVISGSDMKGSKLTQKLAEMGARICCGHSAKNIQDAEVVIISSAIPPENEELKEAIARGLPIHRRAELLGWLMHGHTSVSVGGAHGKTTTTSMTSHLLQTGELDPTLVVGGVVNSLGSNVRRGAGHFMVVEADESDGSFLLLPSSVVVVTNIDDDHLETYGTMENMEAAYLQFINAVGPEGLAILCVDDPRVRRLLGQVRVPRLLYGLSESANLRAVDLKYDGHQSSYRVLHDGQHIGTFTLSVPGQHNVLNSLAAVAVARHAGVSSEAIARGLSTFSGVKRRFQFIGEAGQIKIFDDYAHHPTEIKATLASARLSRPRRLVALFQPHRYSRTEMLASSFAQAFVDADVVMLLPVYSAGEKARDGVSSGLIYQRMVQDHRYVIQLSPRPTLESHVPLICSQLEPGDWFFTVGAGDVNQMGTMILSHLEQGATS